MKRKAGIGWVGGEAIRELGIRADEDLRPLSEHRLPPPGRYSNISWEHVVTADFMGYVVHTAFELMSNAEKLTSVSPDIAAAVAEAMMEEGVICRNIGEALCFCPPLIITEQDADRIVDAMRKALTAAA